MAVSLNQMASIAKAGEMLENFQRRAEAAIAATCQRYSQLGAAYARENRPWQDRSGDARRGLHGYVNKDRLISARISHGVLYGIMLEKRYHGKLGVLPKVKQRFQAEFYEDIKKAVGGALRT